MATEERGMQVTYDCAHYQSEKDVWTLTAHDAQQAQSGQLMHDHEKSPLAADKQVPRSKHMNFQWQRAAGLT